MLRFPFSYILKFKFKRCLCDNLFVPELPFLLLDLVELQTHFFTNTLLVR